MEKIRLTYKRLDPKFIQVKCNVCSGHHRVAFSIADQKSDKPFVLNCPKVDRRYRLFEFHMEFRRNIINHPADGIDQLRDDVLRQLKTEYGEIDFDAKLKRWLSIKYPDLAIGEEYINLLKEMTDAYTRGNYFNSMTSAGVLVERTLNRLLFKLSRHFTNDPDYGKILKKQSFDKWEWMGGILKRWSIIDDKQVLLLEEIKRFRNESVHYNENYPFDLKAPMMVDRVGGFINSLLSVSVRNDIFFNTPGEFWVRKDAEELPFVKEFVIPMCYRANPTHTILNKQLFEYSPKIGKLTDDEFRNARANFSHPEGGH
jgi:hypothetical protein